MAISALFSLQARVIEVESTGEYAGALSAALTGDTLLLTASGTYTHQNLPAGKVVTVMAPDTADVVINGESKFNECDGGGICYENVTLSNPNRLFWDAGGSGVGTIEIISFKNCEITNIAYSLLCCNSAVDVCRIKKLVFDHCTIHNISKAGWNFLRVKVAIEELVVNECTFYDENKSSSFLDSTIGAKEGETPTIKLTMTHNTFYIGANTFLSVGNNYSGEGSSMVIEDNIFVCPDGKSFKSFTNISAGYWEVSVKNNLFAGIDLPTLGEDYGSITLENNYTPEDLGITKEDIFADAASKNFTIYAFSPIATKSTTEGVLGASDWLKDVEVVTLTHGLAEGVDSLAGTINGPKGKVEKGGTFKLTAVKNFGYKFVKWVDGTGAMVSEEPELTVTADKDLTYYAVFEAVKVYNMNVSIKGGSGGVSIDVAGKDGKYEQYEEGTVLHLSAKENKVTSFVCWEVNNDLLSQPEIELTVNSDINVVAEFFVKSFVCAFTFDTNTQQGSSGWPADLIGEAYAEPDNRPLWKCYSTYDDSDKGFLLGSFYNAMQSYAWKSLPAEGHGYYFQTVINTKGYISDVVVDFTICGIYLNWKKIMVQMSYDSERWETVDTVTVTGSFANHVDTLPYSSNQEKLYVRFMPDLEAGYNGSGNECVEYHDIYFIAEAAPSAIEAVKNDEEDAPVRYYDLMGRHVAPDAKGMIIRVQGNKAIKLINK